jgi:hypothetical protein
MDDPAVTAKQLVDLAKKHIEDQQRRIARQREYAKYRMVLIRGTLFAAGSRRRNSALPGRCTLLANAWCAAWAARQPRIERVAPRARQFNVGRVFMSPTAVDRARPLIQGKLIPYLYQLIHNQASCVVSHFGALTGKAVRHGSRP